MANKSIKWVIADEVETLRKREKTTRNPVRN